MQVPSEKIIEQTINWIKSVVIDCNFCPFAASAVLKKNIHYKVVYTINLVESLTLLKQELIHLDAHSDIETSFIIFAQEFDDFNDYLKLIKKSEQILYKENYEGIYQIASFHPNYCFADAEDDDAANYTNRSIYPMIHILREESLTKAISLYPNAELIPHHNIEFARKKGLQYMQMLRLACL